MCNAKQCLLVPHIQIMLKAGAEPTEDSNENIKKGMHTIATLHAIYWHIHLKNSISLIRYLRIKLMLFFRLLITSRKSNGGIAFTLWIG